MKDSNITINITEEMDFTKLSKLELLTKCEQLGITKCKSKTKPELITLIQNNIVIPKVEFVIDGDFLIVEGDYEVDGDENVVISSHIPLIKSSTHLKPIIKWSGGKSDEIKMFEKYFPVNYNKYIEPFIGGGSVYFYLNPTNAVISDVHSELIDLYNNIGEGKMNDIYEFMEQTPNDEETLEEGLDEWTINKLQFYAGIKP